MSEVPSLKFNTKRLATRHEHNGDKIQNQAAEYKLLERNSSGHVKAI
jgi:hypothetical protein